MMRALVERGADLELWRPVFAADPRYLEAALDQVRLSFGSIEAYFADGLGVDGATQEALRAAFVR
jgi:protein-tyrosine phosphatase